MAVSATLVRDIAPELASESDSRIELFIDFAKLNVNEPVWGDKYDLGVAVYTAHLLTMSNSGGGLGGGAVVSEKVGDLARSYAAPKNSNDSLELTTYGKWFLQMRRTLLITPLCL